MPVKPIPEGFHTLTPYLVVDGAENLVHFLEHAFGGTLLERMNRPDGGVMHAQMKIGDSMIMIADSMGERKAMPTSIYVYVKNCDEVHRKAVEAGGTSIMEPADMFYGDRHGGVKDPTGNQWWIATHIEDLSREELARRAEGFMKQRA